MQSFDIWQLFEKLKLPLTILLIGVVMLLGGFLIYKSNIFLPETNIEVLNSAPVASTSGTIVAEISGAVAKPNVYKMENGARIEDLLVISGGLLATADRNWVDKYLNRAAKLSDGQKVFIPALNYQSNLNSASVNGGDQSVSTSVLSDNTRLTNINTADLSELDFLPGIGQVYGQNIIDHRPYSDISELLSKGVLKASVYQKIKNLITVY